MRAKLDRSDDADGNSVLAVLVHGDAAFAGQGVVAETLNLSQLQGYSTAGTIHLVINNQLGFTTSPLSARSSHYATDIAKMIQAPVFHVNGDDPEACARVARIAADYRQTFHKDAVIDMVCYRRHGHNEGDDPSYTQPLMYKKINAHRSVRKLYTESLIKRGDITLDEAEQALSDFLARLQVALDETRSTEMPHLDRLPDRPVYDASPLGASTSVKRDLLDAIAARLNCPPPGFVAHPKLAKQLATRASLYEGGEVDWALGEALAYGTLLAEGVDVRVAGQDTRRGTFSHRHAVLVDYETGVEFTPLANLGQSLGDNDGPAVPASGRFQIYDTFLSEYAALAFEYGYSVEASDAFVAWEAQFGDFANGAQIVIDQFIVAAEEKWGQSSSLVLMLPHGYEGQGAEHSSARLERFLTLAADGNITVVQPTTAAQLFHLFRAQAKMSPRRPLVAMMPKSLLRSRQARSSIEDLVSGQWNPVLDDPSLLIMQARPDVRRIVCSSGKIAFDALVRRDSLAEAGNNENLAAILRLEQVYPWPDRQLLEVLDRYPNAVEFVFLQDEPENMGAWYFVHEKLHRLFRDRYLFRHVTRAASGSPATGSHLVHEAEVGDLLDRAVGRIEI